jgi:hypothetical protein
MFNQGGNMSQLPDIVVPNDDLEFEPPVFENVKTGYYTAVFKGGAEIQEGENDKGEEWKALVLPFTGFANDESEDKFARRTVNARYSFGFSFAKVVKAAKAFGLTDDTGEGHKLVTTESDELVEGFNAYAGQTFKVYVQTGPRRRRNPDTEQWEVQYREGTQEPWIDSRITDVEAT